MPERKEGVVPVQVACLAHTTKAQELFRSDFWNGEFRSTLDAYQEDLIRQGLPEVEARRKARIDLGQPAVQNETYRDAIGLRLSMN